MAQNLHLVLVTFPGYGHVRPMRALAREYVARGYPITVITSSHWKKQFDTIPGIRFVALQGAADIDIDNMDELYPERESHQGPARAFFDLEHIFIEPIDAQFELVQGVLKGPELADKQVVMLADPVFLGNMPMLLESTKARRVPVVGIGHLPLMLNSKDTAPFGPGIPSQGVEKNIAMNEQANQMFTPTAASLRKRLEPYECKELLPYFFDNFFRLQDAFCQLCPQELELPRTDLPPNFRFVGSLQGCNEKKQEPEWFQSFVRDDTTGHPLLLVTSGSLKSIDAHDLILPTLDACRDLPVRVIVCAVHASIPADFALPSNARITEWIAFEDIFPYTSLVVSNGGYGGICQALGAGIPMVVSGTTEDKTESTLRAEMTGAAINLRTQRVTVEQIQGAVKEVLNVGKYKEKALLIQAANNRCNAVDSILDAAKELATKFYAQS